ncbi:hypothetical protein HMPREF2531_03936 [Bacteroides intestinalis]|uniref:Uncharacterized protein n=1 Tax=Bacteroides intestinalis TaxID=329854 RepID=A0A139KYE5_9BACE|nr:hypothetical protein HMPREF2531_03936 [Bacteroides intestinalis]
MYARGYCKKYDKNIQFLIYIKSFFPETLYLCAIRKEIELVFIGKRD